MSFVGVHRCIECIDDTLDILVYRKYRKHCDTQASIESIPKSIPSYQIGHRASNSSDSNEDADFRDERYAANWALHYDLRY